MLPTLLKTSTWLSTYCTNVPASVQVEGDDSKLFYAGVFDGHGNATTTYAHTSVDMVVRLIYAA